MKPLGDRRGRIRMEILGSLWGALEIDSHARILNISRGGALIASPVPVALDSIQMVKFILNGDEIRIQARVRHVHRTTPNGDEETPFQLGIEFLQPILLAHALP